MMSLQERSKQLELEYANQNLDALFMEHKVVLIAQPMEYINQFLDEPYDKHLDFMCAIHENLNKNYDDLPNMLYHMIIAILTSKSKEMSAAAVLGMAFGRFECGNYSWQFRTAAKLLEAIQANPVIRCAKRGTLTVFVTTAEVSNNIQARADKLDFPLPPLWVEPLTNNSSIGYQTLNEHVIAGKKNKHHKLDICLDHINRLNAITFRLEPRLFTFTVATFNNKPKMLDSGHYETDKQVDDRRIQHKHLHSEVPNKARLMLKEGNQFKILNKYDTRLRTYARARHFNYQDCKFLKAMVQLDTKEVATGEW